MNQETETNVKPKTIDELKEWYKARNLPPEETTRFFIGKNIREPKAFGIYKDDYDNYFIVYKNKANGERIVHYSGYDESYAVNELYEKLKEEIENRKFGKTERTESSHRSKSKDPVVNTLDIASDILNHISGILHISFRALIFIAFIWGIFDSFVPKKTGYYRNQGHTYYKYDRNNWYVYDTLSDIWEYVDYTSIPVGLIDDPDQYYEGDTWTSEFGSSDFKTTDQYSYLKESEAQDSHSGWSNDSSYDWDSGSSWDSGDTDWDSDW